MPKIDEYINLGLRIFNDPRQMSKNANDIQNHYQKIGKEAGEAMVTEVEKKIPRIRKAFNQVTEANANRIRVGRNANKVQAQANALDERSIALGKEIIAQQARANALAQAEADLLTREAQLKDKVTEATKAQTDAEDKLAKKKSAHANGSKKELGEIDREIRALRAEAKLIPDKKARGAVHRQANIMAHESSPLRDKEAKEREAIANYARFVASLKQETEDLVAEYKAASATITQLQNGKKKALSDLDSTQDALNKTTEESIKIDEAKTRSTEDLEKAERRRAESLAALEDAKQAEADREKKAKAGRHKSGGGTGGVLGSMLTDLPGVPGGRAGAIIGSGVLVALASVAEAVVTASQTVALLPAIAVAGGAAIGTLALGFSGLGDAIKEMGDPEKFAKALQSLSPAAQQAALEIQFLAQGPFKELKDAVQDTLLDGVAEQLHNLSNVFLPTIKTLTTGIGGAFNGMFDQLSASLMTPESQASISTMVNNIVLAFQNLQPAIQPIVAAFLKLSEVGSSFLPGMATGFANLMTKFSNFVNQAAQDGSLQNFIQKGIDAFASLSSTILSIGQEIYEVFGNKTPDEFKATLDTIVDTAIGVAQAIGAVAGAVNNLLEVIRPVADAIGGWENLITTALAVFVGAKMASAIAGVGKLTGAIGGGSGVAGALSKLPMLAGVAAGGVQVALAGVATALGVSMANILNYYNKVADLKAQVNAEAGQNGSPVLRAPVQGPGIGNIPNLPGAPGASPGNTTTRSPLDIFGPTGPGGSQAVGPGTTYKDLYGSGAPATPAVPDNAGLGPWNERPVPEAPPDASGVNTDSEKIAAELAKLNPQNFMPQVGAIPQAGPNADPQEVYNAYNKLVEEGQDVRDARMDLAAMEAAGVSTQLEILQAKEKIAAEEHDFYNAQYELAEKAQGKLGKMSDAFGQIGANLDDDLGFSKGLPGLADNLVRFIASLATAPIQGALAPLAAGAKGTGILGMLGYNPDGNSSGGTFAQGMANYGVQSFMGSSTAAYAGVANGSDMDVTNQPGLGLLRAMGLKGTTYASHTTDGAATDREVDVTDPVGGYGSGLMTQFANFARQNPHLFEEFIYSDPTTGQKTGIRSGQLVGPGTSQPGYYADDWGGHQDHAHMEPAKGGGLEFGGAATGAASALNGLTAAVQGATGALSGPSSTGMPWSADWNAMAQAESSGNWQANTGNGFFGGLQFQQSSWDAAGGGQYAGRADLATPYQQAMVAENLLKMQGPGAWPNTFVPGSSGPASSPGWGFGAPGAGGLPAPGTVPTGGPLGTGFPTGFGPGMAPQAPPGAPQPGGLGNTLGAGFSSSYAPTTPSEQAAPSWSPQGGGQLGSGFLQMAMGLASGAAGMGANMFAPGSGAAAQAAADMAMKAINRTIAFGGQAAGIGMQGLMETFGVSDPDGGGNSGGSSWLTRIAGGLAGAKPAGGMGAGKADKGSQVDPNDPRNQQGQPGQPGAPGQQGNTTTNNYNSTIHLAPDKQTGQAMTNELNAAAYNAHINPG